MPSAENRAVVGAVAALITLVLIGGVVGALTTSDSESTSKPAVQKTPAEDAAARRAAEDAKRQAADLAVANGTALKSIITAQEECKSKYLAAAQARAEQARQDLKVQQDTLQRIYDQLPPGKAKDTLGEQLPLEFQTANQFVDSELRAAEDRCRLALTVYQYTVAEGTGPKEPG